MKRSELSALAASLGLEARDVRWIRFDPDKIVASVIDCDVDGQFVRNETGDDIISHEEDFFYDNTPLLRDTEEDTDAEG